MPLSLPSLVLQVRISILSSLTTLADLTFSICNQAIILCLLTEACVVLFASSCLLINKSMIPHRWLGCWMAVVEDLAREHDLGGRLMVGARCFVDHAIPLFVGTVKFCKVIIYFCDSLWNIPLMRSQVRS